MEVTGSSPVLPIRENKNECGKEMRMSVCLTQPNGFAVIVIVSEHLRHVWLTKGEQRV